MTRIAVVGPNLQDPKGYDFHVHAAGCADQRRPIYRGYESDWKNPVDVDSVQEMVVGVYCDIMDENGKSDADFVDYLDGFKIFPCVKNLPQITSPDVEITAADLVVAVAADTACTGGCTEHKTYPKADVHCRTRGCSQHVDVCPSHIRPKAAAKLAA